MSPREVGACSNWQISQAIAGYARAHGGDEARNEGPSLEDFKKWKAS